MFHPLFGEKTSYRTLSKKLALAFQIPYEDRCLYPQTPPEARRLGVPNTDPHKV